MITLTFPTGWREQRVVFPVRGAVHLVTGQVLPIKDTAALLLCEKPFEMDLSLKSPFTMDVRNTLPAPLANRRDAG